MALYIILFLGYMIYERFYEGKMTHFVPSSEVDLVSDAVWGPGQGDQIRAQDLKDSEMKMSSMKLAFSSPDSELFLTRWCDSESAIGTI